jgi:hypothetical protein
MRGYGKDVRDKLSAAAAFSFAMVEVTMTFGEVR